MSGPPLQASRPLSPRAWLAPLMPLYAAAAACKNAVYDFGFAKPLTLRAPVISIGNLSTGGSGKTPFVFLLAQLLIARGHSVDVLSRGFGRTGSHAVQVDPSGDATHFGDEPLLLAQRGLDVFVAAQRYQAGLLAESTSVEARMHLLDDGFQHRQLARTVDIVLVTARDLEDRLLPAGNLREPISSLRRAHVIVLREEDAALRDPLLDNISKRAATTAHAPAIWLIRRSLSIQSTTSQAAPTHPFAFCGLARPADFQDSLAAVGLSPIEFIAFPDHHHYTLDDMQHIVQQAQSSGADGLLTTAKDAVKLTPPMLAALSAAGPLAIAELHLQLVEEDRCMRELLELISAV